MPNFKLVLIIYAVACIGATGKIMAWGFEAHRQINSLAVFTLPPEMIGFYKQNRAYLSAMAVNPDRRRGINKKEGPRHYFDVDGYGPNVNTLPLFLDSAIARCGEDSLLRHGTAPWHLGMLKVALTKAFAERQPERILKLSAEAGHYLSDIYVPLHTTSNHNGQKTYQNGIHALWETQIPHAFYYTWTILPGKANYIEYPQKYFMETALRTHVFADSVLLSDYRLRLGFPERNMYAWSMAGGGAGKKVYTFTYASEWYYALNGMHERRFTEAVKAVGDLWFTCWVDAGQPDLKPFLNFKFSTAERKKLEAEEAAWKIRKAEAEQACDE
ncbi:MAG: zinc dependent phospholipase C family protein [Bacteroidota bacterium]